MGQLKLLTLNDKSEQLINKVSKGLHGAGSSNFIVRRMLKGLI